MVSGVANNIFLLPDYCPVDITGSGTSLESDFTFYLFSPPSAVHAPPLTDEVSIIPTVPSKQDSIMAASSTTRE